MYLLFLAMFGGAVGAGCRFLVNQSVADAMYPHHFATLTVNIVGGFLMGIVMVVVNQRLDGSPEWRTFLATGILGGFTTFSAYTNDMMNLIKGGDTGFVFMAYTIGTVVLAFLALTAGMFLARAVLA